MRDNNPSFLDNSEPIVSRGEHQTNSINHPSRSKRSRGGRYRKKANSTSGGSSVASSDAGSLTSGASSSPNGNGKYDSATQDHAYDSTSPAYDKKKSSNRRRRKPKLRNKVDNIKHNNGDENSPPANVPRKYTFGWNTTVCPASKGGPTSKKQHDAPMMKRDLYFSLHCDRVAIGAKKACVDNDSPSAAASTKTEAVARVTLINWENETVLDTFVRVPVPVTDFYDTGIKAEDVATDSPNAMPFASVRQTVESTLKGKILIGHKVEDHLMALGLTHPWTDTRDCAVFFKGQNSKVASLSLDTLCKERLLRSLPPPDHAERSMQNCLASLDLYKKNRKEWEEFLIAEARKKSMEEEEQVAHAQRLRTFSYASSGQKSHSPRSRLGSRDGINVNAVALHCSTVATCNNMLALARVTVLNSFYQVLWDTFVQIHEPILDDCGYGIFPQDVTAAHGALPVSMVRQQLERLLHGKLIVGYKLDESLGALGITYPPSQLRDIAYFRPFMYAEMDGVSGNPVIVERSLDELSFEVLQKPLVPLGHRNRPLSTCSVVLELYEIYQEHWEQEMYMQQQQHGSHSSGMMQFPHDSSQTKSSWFGWGKRQPAENIQSLQNQQAFQTLSGSSSLVTSVALSTQAFQALHGEASSPPGIAAKSDFSHYEATSYVGGSSVQDGSSYYEPSLKSRLDDSSRGILESFTVESVVSSINDDMSSAAGDRTGVGDLQSSTSQKSSSWFRFGSRKPRYSSPSSRVSMMSVQELADEPPEMSLGSSPVEPPVSADPAYTQSGNNDAMLNEEATSSRAWFGFGRRASSPGRAATNNSRHRRTRSCSPESPLSGAAAAASQSDPDATSLITEEVPLDGSVHAIEVALSTSSLNQVMSPLTEVPEALSSDQDQHAASLSWFGFRRTKSQRNASEASDDPSDLASHLGSILESTSEPDVVLTTTEKTDATDDDWLQEVMSQSTGTGANDDLNSVGLVSLLESDAGLDETETTKESRKSSRGQSWFGFKRSKSHKTSRLEAVSDAVEDNEDNQDSAHLHQLPNLVSVNKTETISSSTKDASTRQTKSPPLGVSWYIGNNRAVSSKSEGSPEDSSLGRTRLPTESTVPTVSTEEEDDSGGAFTEEFEKGVAQSFAYLEI